jgi:hypothetical protein
MKKLNFHFLFELIISSLIILQMQTKTRFVKAPTSMQIGPIGFLQEKRMERMKNFIPKPLAQCVMCKSIFTVVGNGSRDWLNRANELAYDGKYLRIAPEVCRFCHAIWCPNPSSMDLSVLENRLAVGANKAKIWRGGFELQNFQSFDRPYEPCVDHIKSMGSCPCQLLVLNQEQRVNWYQVNKDKVSKYEKKQHSPERVEPETANTIVNATWQ